MATPTSSATPQTTPPDFRPVLSPATWWALGGLALLGVALRLPTLVAGCYSLDESYTVIQTRVGWGQIVALAPTDSNPPVNVLVYKAWSTIFGTGEAALESLSVLVGGLTIGLFGWVARRFRPFPHVTLLAGLFLATSPVHVDVSQQMRSYALALVWSLLALEGLLRDMERPGRGSAILCVGSAFLLVNTHYYGLFVVTALLLASLVSGWLGGPSRVRRSVVLGGALGLALLPSLAALYLQYTRYVSFDWIPEPSAGVLLPMVLAFGRGSVLLVAFYLGLAVVGARALVARGQRPALAVLVSWWVVPLVLAYGVSALGKPFLHQRYAVLWLLPLLLLAAVGTSEALRRRRLLGGLLVLALVLASGPPLVTYYQERLATRWQRQLHAQIAADHRPGDVVLHLDKSLWGPGEAYDPHIDQAFYRGLPSSNIVRYWLDAPAELGWDELGAWSRVWVTRPPALDLDMNAIFAQPAFRAYRPRLDFVDDHRTLFLFTLTCRSAQCPVTQEP